MQKFYRQKQQSNHQLISHFLCQQRRENIRWPITGRITVALVVLFRMWWRLISLKTKAISFHHKRKFRLKLNRNNHHQPQWHSNKKSFIRDSKCIRRCLEINEKVAIKNRNQHQTWITFYHQVQRVKLFHIIKSIIKLCW